MPARVTLHHRHGQFFIFTRFKIIWNINTRVYILNGTNSSTSKLNIAKRVVGQRVKGVCYTPFGSSPVIGSINPDETGRDEHIHPVYNTILSIDNDDPYVPAFSDNLNFKLYNTPLVHCIVAGFIRVLYRFKKKTI